MSKPIDGKSNTYSSDRIKGRLSVLRERNDNSTLSEDEADELLQLAALEQEFCLCPSWNDGDVFVSEDHWEQYCRDRALGLEDLSNYIQDYVDWARLAEDAKSEVREAEIFGNVYYFPWN